MQKKPSMRSHFAAVSAKLGIAAESMLLKATENIAGVAMIVMWVYNDTGVKLDKYHRREHGHSG